MNKKEKITTININIKKEDILALFELFNKAKEVEVVGNKYDKDYNINKVNARINCIEQRIRTVRNNADRRMDNLGVRIENVLKASELLNEKVNRVANGTWRENE